MITVAGSAATEKPSTSCNANAVATKDVIVSGASAVYTA